MAAQPAAIEGWNIVSEIIQLLARRASTRQISEATLERRLTPW
jgi:hypothetical protein